jgi:hypothetical protein
MMGRMHFDSAQGLNACRQEGFGHQEKVWTALLEVVGMEPVLDSVAFAQK